MQMSWNSMKDKPTCSKVFVTIESRIHNGNSYMRKVLIAEYCSKSESFYVITEDGSNLYHHHYAEHNFSKQKLYGKIDTITAWAPFDIKPYEGE